MKFQLVQANQLTDVWEYVKAGLARIREKGKVKWIDEEVFAAVYRGRAGLFLAMDGEDRRGFVATEVRKDDNTGLPTLHVWLCWGEPRKGEHYADASVFTPDMVAFLDEHAKQMTGSSRWTFDGLKGWERYLKGYCEPMHTRFERVLT